MKLEELSVAKTKLAQFNKKGIYTVEELLRVYPRKYVDYRTPAQASESLIGERCSMILYVEDVHYNNGRMPVVTVLGMERQSQREVEVIWFNAPYMYEKVINLEKHDVIVCGKLGESRGMLQFSSPEFFSDDINAGLRIMPVYRKIPGMSSDYFDKIMNKCLDYEVIEPLPEAIIERFDLVSETEMIRKIHRPKSPEDLKAAGKKQILNILYEYAKVFEADSCAAARMSPYIPTFLTKTNTFIKQLPYSLTTDQKEIVKKFVETAQSGKRVNALLQGDVGSGKTVCAFLLMMAMADNGFQSALMAPTGILAKQHYEELKGYAEPLGFTAVYLSGDLKAKERREVLKQIKDGTADFVVGTHAVIAKDVEFKSLGLTVVDEEHKFGVEQRERLREKAGEGVHSVSMSATPIPRSLAIAVYGDILDVYTISTMPAGRKPVLTQVVNNDKSAYGFMKSQIDKGRQCYIVCPLITNDDKADIKDDGKQPPKSVEEVFETTELYLSPYGIKSAVITGKMKDAQKAEIIQRFKDGEIQVLIATTIIEVGVNVPNATVMTIENAERFGLAGLHQLRGRVGRSSLQSYCMLKSTEKNNPRLRAMCETTDGFKIAEADLSLRGAGDMIGVKQSGTDEKFALVLKYPGYLTAIRKMIKEGECM